MQRGIKEVVRIQDVHFSQRCVGQTEGKVTALEELQVRLSHLFPQRAPPGPHLLPNQVTSGCTVTTCHFSRLKFKPFPLFSKVSAPHCLTHQRPYMWAVCSWLYGLQWIPKGPFSVREGTASHLCQDPSSGGMQMVLNMVILARRHCSCMAFRCQI